MPTKRLGDCLLMRCWANLPISTYWIDFSCWMKRLRDHPILQLLASVSISLIAYRLYKWLIQKASIHPSFKVYISSQSLKYYNTLGKCLRMSLVRMSSKVIHIVWLSNANIVLLQTRCYQIILFDPSIEDNAFCKLNCLYHSTKVVCFRRYFKKYIQTKKFYLANVLFTSQSEPKRP